MSRIQITVMSIGNSLHLSYFRACFKAWLFCFPFSLSLSQMTLEGYLGYRFQETFKISMLGSGKEDHNQSQLFNKVEQHKVILYIIHLNPCKTGSHNQREGPEQTLKKAQR